MLLNTELNPMKTSAFGLSQIVQDWAMMRQIVSVESDQDPTKIWLGRPVKSDIGESMDDECWESQPMKNSSQGCFPSDKSSALPEGVIKLLLLVAGDVETNPGPMVRTFSSNM